MPLTMTSTPSRSSNIYEDDNTNGSLLNMYISPKRGVESAEFGALLVHVDLPKP